MNIPHYPATLRNRDPILSILQQHLPNQGFVLETASGSGEHIEYFASYYPNIQWQPSDKNDELFWAFQQRHRHASNILTPQIIDLTQDRSQQQYSTIQKYDALLNINMIHISPQKTCQGLFSLATQVVRQTGFVYMYGPYKRNGKHTSTSNEVFDANLRAQNPLWGVRDMEEVISTASQFDFEIHQIEAMPANNFSLVFFHRNDHKNKNLATL